MSGRNCNLKNEYREGFKKGIRGSWEGLRGNREGFRGSYSTLGGKTDKLDEAVNRELNVTRS